MSVHGQIDEYARWEARFATPDYAFGKEPNYFLKSCQKLLPRRGQALAVADGEGRNGVWLTEQGLDVVSLDFSPAAQSKARALAAERGVKVNFVQADVHAWDLSAGGLRGCCRNFRAVQLAVRARDKMAWHAARASRGTRPSNCNTAPADRNG